MQGWKILQVECIRGKSSELLELEKIIQRTFITSLEYDEDISLSTKVIPNKR